MEKDLYRELMTAKKSGNIVKIRGLYNNNPDDLLIKFEYAKLLKKVDIDLAKKLFKELIGTSNENFALLELGSIERSSGNFDLSHSYFEKILTNSKSSIKDKYFAIMELGKLEVILGNKIKAKEYFNSLLGTFNECYALLELGKLEFSEGHIEKAKELFKKGISTKCGIYALLWLGRAETSQGNYMMALVYFNEILNTSIGNLARKEIEEVRRLQSEESKELKKLVRRKENEG